MGWFTGAAGGFNLTWPSVSGKTYRAFWSTDLAIWTKDSIHLGTGGNISALIDLDGLGLSNEEKFFVRVSVEDHHRVQESEKFLAQEDSSKKVLQQMIETKTNAQYTQGL